MRVPSVGVGSSFQPRRRVDADVDTRHQLHCRAPGFRAIQQVRISDSFDGGRVTRMGGIAALEVPHHPRHHSDRPVSGIEP